MTQQPRPSRPSRAALAQAQAMYAPTPAARPAPSHDEARRHVRDALAMQLALTDAKDWTATIDKLDARYRAMCRRRWPGMTAAQVERSSETLWLDVLDQLARIRSRMTMTGTA